MIKYSLSDFACNGLSNLIGFDTGMYKYKFQTNPIRYEQYIIYQNGELAQMRLEFSSDVTPTCWLTLYGDDGRPKADKIPAKYSADARRWLYARRNNLAPADGNLMAMCFREIGNMAPQTGRIVRMGHDSYQYESRIDAPTTINKITIDRNTPDARHNHIRYRQNWETRLYPLMEFEQAILYKLMQRAYASNWRPR